MDPVVTAAIVGVAVLIGLAIGLAIGWWLGGKPVADARAEREEAQGEVRALSEKFNAAIRDLAGASERARLADDLAIKLDTSRGDHAAMSTELASISERAKLADELSTRLDTMRIENRNLSGEIASKTERAKLADELASQLFDLRTKHGLITSELSAMKADAANHDKQIKLLTEAREQLTQQFGEVGNKLLGEAQKAFLERADQRFAQSEEKHEEKIKTLLAPVGERLKEYREQVDKIEQSRTEAYGDLKGLMDQMRTGQQQVRDETARLVNSLRNAPKARGRWGEQQLRNVLESCGLAEHTDFMMEVSVETEEGARMRPDAIIRIPGGRSLIVDAKVSLNDYQDAFEAGDDLAKSTSMARHCLSMKNHVNTLGGKAYQTQFGDAPDYVIMFVPGEHFLSAALDHDATLWDFAFSRKVLIATPTNLVAIARTVSSVWQQEALAKNAREIADLGKEMHERLAKAAEDLKKVGANLGKAVSAYNGFANSFEGRLMVTGRKFEKLNIETGKRELEPIAEIEALPRYGDTVLVETDEGVGLAVN